MGEPAKPLHVDPDELERVTAEVIRDTPAHLVPGEVRRRLGLLSARREPSESAKERARRVIAKMRRG